MRSDDSDSSVEEIVKVVDGSEQLLRISLRTAARQGNNHNK
jgi:hypothetical protein